MLGCSPCVCAQEFQYAEQLSAGIGGVKPVSWSGIRAMISEVQQPVLVAYLVYVWWFGIYIVSV